MKQVEEGLFALEEQMPCSPRDIKICKFALPSMLGSAAREEAAARILFFSQQLNQWVGVSSPRLAEMLRKDYEAQKCVEEVHNHNFHERQRVRHALRRYYVLCALTLGIYALFVKKPMAQIREMPELPFSGIFLFGSRHVIIGIHELLNEGMIRRVTEGEGENAFDVFFPTPALLRRIMEKQGVAT